MSKKNIYFSFIAAVFSLALIFVSSTTSLPISLTSLFSTPKIALAQTSATTLSGYLWSSNIGWINLGGGSAASGGTYPPVSIDSFGTLSGNGWSSNVGWLSFGANSCGGTNAAPKYTNNAFSGFALFLSGSGRSDGWDGCVSLSGTAADNSHYGVVSSGTAVSGYAWGSNVVGWIDFSGVTLSGSQQCPAGQILVNGVCTNGDKCTPGTQTCGGGLVCSSAGTCPAKCPDGTPLPPSKICSVASSQNTFTATGLCSSATKGSVSLVLNIPNAENGTYRISKSGAQITSGSLDSGGHGNYNDSNLPLNTSYNYTTSVTSHDGTQTITLPSGGSSASATTPPPSVCSSQYSNAGTLTSSPAFVAKGGTCTLSWKDVNVSTDYSCRLINVTPGVSEPSSAVSGSTGSKDETNLQQTSKYQIKCTGSAQGEQPLSSNVATCSVGIEKEF